MILIMRKFFLLFFLLLSLSACSNTSPSTTEDTKDEREEILKFLESSEELRGILNKASLDWRKLTVEEERTFNSYLINYDKDSNFQKEYKDVDFELISSYIQLLESDLGLSSRDDMDFKKEFEMYHEDLKQMIAESKKKFIYD